MYIVCFKWFPLQRDPRHSMVMARCFSRQHPFTDQIVTLSTFHALEVVLAQAGIQHGKIERPGMPFRRFMHLKQLRHRRKKSNSQKAEFASMLEGLFVWPLAIVRNAPTVLEQPWTLEELHSNV